MARKLLEWCYMRLAQNMPLWFNWQWDFVGAARWYFELHSEGDFTGWPWEWSLGRFDLRNGETP